MPEGLHPPSITTTHTHACHLNSRRPVSSQVGRRALTSFSTSSIYSRSRYSEQQQHCTKLCNSSLSALQLRTHMLYEYIACEFLSPISKHHGAPPTYCGKLASHPTNYSAALVQILTQSCVLFRIPEYLTPQYPFSADIIPTKSVALQDKKQLFPMSRTLLLCMRTPLLDSCMLRAYFCEY